MTELGEKISALRAEGKTYREIISETGAAKSTIAYYCGDGVREGNRRRSRDKRSKITKFIQEFKQGSICSDCGEDYPYWILEFDHVRGDKLFNIAMYRQFTENLGTVKEEIAKCDVVCSNCHKNRTHFRLVSSGESIANLEGSYLEV